MSTTTPSDGGNTVVHPPVSEPASQSSIPADNAQCADAVTEAHEGADVGAPTIASIVPDTPCVDAALAFYRAGFRVIPGHPEKKHSAVKWGDWLDRLSPETIASHYVEHPDHTLCCILDERVLVLDADTSLAVSALDILEQKFGIESNFVVNTRRGQHRYYHLREGVVARTSAHSTEAHPERIDVKAARSLVVLPPSPNKTIASGDISSVDDLVEVGQDFVDAVFQHNGSEPPREHLSPQSTGERPVATANLHELQAMFDQLDPDRSYEVWSKGLMAAHFETGGSEAGFELVNRWSGRGAKYCGERELRAKWRSFDGYTGTPVTAGTLRYYLAQHGGGVASDSGFQVCDYEVVEVVPPEMPASAPSTGVSAAPDTDEGDVQSGEEADVQITPELILTAYSLTGRLKQLKREAREQVRLLDGLALIGQATVFFAAPNTGKTLLVLWLLIEAIKERRIDPALVFYLNCDDSLSGLIQKVELAEKYGFHMVAEGYQGFEARKFVALLHELIASDQARGVVIVLDTLKKFTDLMDKRTSAGFMTVIRKFVLKGGTVVLLAHTNKNPGPDGKPVFAGTTDVLDDVDCGYIMWATDDPDTGKRVVQFENRKTRGDVRQQAAFAYLTAESLSYLERLASVRAVDEPEVVTLQVAASNRADDELVAVTKTCIREGIVMRMALLAAIALRSKCGRRRAQEVLDKYTGDDPLQHHWTYDVQARGAKVYRLLGPPPVATPSETPTTDMPEGSDHE